MIVGIADLAVVLADRIAQPFRIRYVQYCRLIKLVPNGNLSLFEVFRALRHFHAVTLEVIDIEWIGYLVDDQSIQVLQARY